jgi:hypothetical protein
MSLLLNSSAWHKSDTALPPNRIPLANAADCALCHLGAGRHERMRKMWGRPVCQCKFLR